MRPGQKQSSGMFRGLKLSLYFSRQQSVLKSRRQCLLVVYRKCLVGTTCSLFHNAVLHSTHTKNRHLLFRIHDGWGRSRWHDKTNTLPENQSWSWKQTDSLRQWCCLQLCYPFLCVSVCVCVCVSVLLEGKWQNKPELPTSWADWLADWFGCIIY